MLARLAGERVPTLLGHDGGRMLLAEIAGDDLYDAEPPQLLEMVTLLVGLQRSWSGRADELLALGLPDWRAPALGASIASVIERTADELSADDRATLDGVSARPARPVRRASPPAASPTRSSMAISIPAISAATAARSPCSTGATAASAIPCWTSRPSSAAFPATAVADRPRALAAAMARCRPWLRSRPRRAPARAYRRRPPGRRSTAASSTASSRPSTPITGTTLPNGCSARPPSSANSGFALDFVARMFLSCSHRRRPLSADSIFDIVYRILWIRSRLAGRRGGSPARRPCGHYTQNTIALNFEFAYSSLPVVKGISPVGLGPPASQARSDHGCFPLDMG